MLGQVVWEEARIFKIFSRSGTDFLKGNIPAEATCIRTICIVSRNVTLIEVLNISLKQWG